MPRQDQKEQSCPFFWKANLSDDLDHSFEMEPIVFIHNSAHQTFVIHLRLIVALSFDFISSLVFRCFHRQTVARMKITLLTLGINIVFHLHQLSSNARTFICLLFLPSHCPTFGLNLSTTFDECRTRRKRLLPDWRDHLVWPSTWITSRKWSPAHQYNQEQTKFILRCQNRQNAQIDSSVFWCFHPEKSLKKLYLRIIYRNFLSEKQPPLAPSALHYSHLPKLLENLFNKQRW